MQKVIGVRFKKAGKIHYFNPGQADIKKGDTVIIDTMQGLTYGEVVISPREIATDQLKIENIRRKASNYDLSRIAENKKLADEAFGICQKKIAEHGLPMNLISVEYTFDMNRIIFSFTAAGRVDFRELVKDLASIFHTRIELHQVGVRDEAKFMGGIGCCGRSLCCATFLGDFIPVSIRMAKEQNLSLNPTKISGICGRLMCCLKFENDYYREFCKTELIKDPKLGDRVIIDEGEEELIGEIISINQQRRTATIMLENSKTKIASFDNIFEAEKVVEDGQVIVARTDDEDIKSEEHIEIEENKSNKYYNNYFKAPNRLSESSINKSNYQNKMSPALQSKPSIPSKNKPSTQTQVKQSSSNSPKSNYFARNKSNAAPPNKSNIRNRDKDNKKNIKRRRSEEYERNKKFRPRRHEINDDDN